MNEGATSVAPVPVSLPRTARAKAWLKGPASFPLWVFVFTRIAYLATSFMGLTFIPNLYLHDEGRQQALKSWPAFDGLCRWDCGWFVRIVEQGYNQVENAKVFPLLPLLGWSVEKATGIHHIVVFLLVSNACALASYFVIYSLFKELEGDDAARAGLMLFVAFPFAYYQAAGYPESMMILGTSLCIWLAKRKRHLAAGVVLGLGLMARHLTISGGAGLLAAHVRQRGWHPKNLLFHRSVLTLLIPWAFLGAFAWYLHVQTGDALAFWNSRTIGWNEWVWYGARQVILYVPYADRPEYFYYIAFALIPAVGAVGLCFKRDNAELAAHGVVLMAVVLSSGAAGMGRYAASAWPGFLWFGVHLARRPNLLTPVVAMLAIIQGLFFFLYSHQWRVL